jgi:hypothetical protein
VSEFDRHYILAERNMEKIEKAAKLLRRAGELLEGVRYIVNSNLPFNPPEERTGRQQEQVHLYDTLGGAVGDLARVRRRLAVEVSDLTTLLEEATERRVAQHWDDQLDENRRRNLEEYGEARPDFPE